MTHIDAITNLNGNIIVSTTYGIYARKYNRVVEVWMYLAGGTTIVKDSLLATLPEGYRPTHQVRVPNYNGTGTLQISANGAMNWLIADTSYAMITITYTA